MEEFDFEHDVKRYPEFIQLMAEEEFCARLWTAFANIDWYKKFDPLLPVEEQVIEVLTDDDSKRWGASFRGMGGVIAALRNEFHDANEDYMYWYCSNHRYDLDYGYVSDTIREALNKIGWFPVEDEYYKDANIK
jgi:hypothetical protein